MVVPHPSHPTPNTSQKLTTTRPHQLGRLTHFAFDAVLVSAFLAGVKRSTGLTYVQYPPICAIQTAMRFVLT